MPDTPLDPTVQAQAAALIAASKTPATCATCGHSTPGSGLTWEALGQQLGVDADTARAYGNAVNHAEQEAMLAAATNAPAPEQVVHLSSAEGNAAPDTAASVG